MKHLVGKQITKKVGFMDDEVEIRKLSVAEVLEVQKLIEKNSKLKNQEESSMKLLTSVIKMAAPAAAELTSEDFNSFPIQELNALSEEILNYSGLGAGNTAGN